MLVRNKSKLLELKPEYFSIQKKSIIGRDIIPNELISSENFINDSADLLESLTGREFFEALDEYSRLLKILIKHEMLLEMDKRLDNIDTFY